MDIKETVRNYIIDATFIDKEKIKDNSLIFKEGIFDSMGFVTLLGFIEDEFGVQPVDADLVEENFESIEAITDYILQKQKMAA